MVKTDNFPIQTFIIVALALTAIVFALIGKETKTNEKVESDVEYEIEHIG